MANSSWGKATSATQRAKDIKKQQKKKKEEQEQKLYYPQNVKRNYYDSDDLLDQMMQERSSRPRPTVTGGTKVSAEPGRREQDTSVTRSNVNTDVASPSELRPTVDPQETRNAAMDMLKRTLGGFQTAAQNAMKYASGDLGPNQLEMAKREAQRQQALNNKLPKFLQSTSAGLPDYFRQYLNMSPEEQTEYNQEYIHNGNAAAERYKDSIQNNINQRIAQENYDKDPFVKNPVGRTVGQFTSGISRFGEGIENLPAWAGISDKKKAASVDRYASQLYKQNSTGKLENIAQDLANTMGYMTPATIAGGAAGAAGLATAKAATLANGLFGLATGGNAYQEAINEGKNKYASAAFGAQQAVDEMVTNYLIGGVKAFGGGLIGKYLSNTGVAKAAQQGIMNLAKTPSGKILLGRMLNHLGHATEEAAQEYLQNFTEKISRNILFGENNKIDPLDPDAWYAAGLGALNALTMNVATDTIHLANNEMQHRAERRAQEEQTPQESYVDVPDEAVREAVDGIIPENNIVSEDPAKTQQENTHDTINAAVDALKEQANENTSTSTPEDAKAAVETANEQIEEAPVENIPQETVENQPTEDIVPEAPARNEELVDEIEETEQNVPVEPIEEPKTANEKLLEIANDLNNNTQENVPEEAAAPSVDAGKLSDILSTADHVNINGFDYNVTETSAGFHGSIRDTSKDIGNVMNGHAINYTYDGPTRQDVIDQLVGVAENNGFIENPNYKDNRNTVNETAMPESKASFAAPDITGEVAKRAEMRFPNNEDAQKVYNGFFPVFNSDGSNELEMYDHFMSMAYQAGLEGNPISSLSDDKVFVNFSSMYPSMIDAIWRTGYNQYEKINRENVKTDADNVNENVDNVNETVDNANENVDNTEETTEENGGNGYDEESRNDEGTEGQPEPVQSGAAERHGEVHTEEAEDVGAERGSVRETENDRRSDDGDVSQDAGSGSRRQSGDGSSEGVQVRDNGRGSVTVEETSTPEVVEEEPAPLAPETVEEVQEQKEDVSLQDMPKGNNFAITADFAKTIPSTPAKRLSANIDALKTLKNIMNENRIATPEEQTLLAAFTGWGGIGDANWKKAEKALTGVLTKDELDHARASITDAYYTNPSLITSIYNGLSGLGFKGGKLLEPSAGVGRFIGAMPASLLPKSRWMAVELDSVSGNIAKLLYPEADVRVQGFQDAKIINDYMDAVIGNVPFGNFGVVDNRYPDYVTSMIHNYFVARALDTLRPGGVACLITSKGTLDAYSSSKARQYFADRADLVGAIRLPETAFKGTGTSVVTDILVFRKRDKNEPYRGESFIDIGYKNGVEQNSYFVHHPDMVLGTYEKTTGQHGRFVMTVKPKSGSLESQIEKAFKKINLKMEYPQVNVHEETVKAIRKEAGNKKEGTAYTRNGKLYLNKDGEEQELKLSEKNLAIYSAAVDIRDTAKALIADMQLGKPTAADRAKLNKLYDEFIKKYPQGFHQSAVKKVLANDTDYAFLQALERVNKDGKKVTIKKADIFTTDTIKPNTVVTHVDNLSDGIETSLNQLGRVDAERIAALMDKPQAEVEKELDQSNLAFRDGNGNFISAQNYLSGNVRAKLKEAEMLADGRPEYQKNVDALKKVVPKDIKGYDIQVNMGATWIAPEYYARFAEHLLNASNNSIKVEYLSGIGYSVEYNSHASRYVDSSAENTSKWGDKKHGYPFMPAGATHPGLLYSILNNKNLEVKYTVEESGGVKKTEHDEIAEAALRELKEKINNEFSNWLWKDTDRTKTLETTYNDLYNCMVNPKFDSKVTIPGQSALISLRDHQASAINRVIQSPYNVIMEHGVGAGKTFAAIGAIMKLKQLGLCAKPTIVVPKNKVDDWARDFFKLFPGATVLKADENTFSAANRKEFINKAATTDADAIIISYEQFTKIPMSKEYEESFYKKELEKLETIIAQNEKKRNATTMQLETRKKRLENKLKKLNDMERDKDNISFEETGIDWIYVDEAQNYKNLAYFTNLQNVADMGNAEGSNRAWDLKMKSDYLRAMQNGKGVTLLTATPIMNSPVEAYNMLRYTHEETLNKMGINTLDDFIQAFGKIEEITRQDAAGRSWKLRTTFNGFINLHEWSSLWRSVVDRVRTQDVPGIKLPKIKGGERTVVKCQATDYSRKVIRGLADRLKNKSQKGANHVFAIQSDAKKASFSQHLLDPRLPYGETEKVPVACNKIYDVWKESKSFKGVDGNDVENGVQLIFCDYGTPKKKQEKITLETVDDTNGTSEEITVDGVNVYKDMKDMLVAKGIPAEEIAFIQDYSGEEKAKLYDKVREGKIRVLIGSTKTMGEGLNVQDRIVAMHEMNPVQRPGDVEQLEGRGKRQGNMSPEVAIYVYVTEDTFDTKQWENIWIKADYISQIEDGVYEGREMDYNTNEFGSSAGDIMAIASGNPLLKEQTEVNDKLRKLKGLQAEHSRNVYDASQKISQLERRIAYNENLIPKFKADEKKVTDLTGDNFKAVIAGKTITEREAFGEELIKHTQKAISEMDMKPRKVGSISGFDIYVSGEIPAIVELRGEASYTNALNLENAKGCATRVTNILNTIPGKAAKYQEEVDHAKEEIPKYKEIAESKFDKEEELLQTEARAAKIEMALQKYKADAEPEKTDDDVLYSKSGHVRTKPEKPTVKEIEAQNAKLEEQKKAEREKGVPTSNVEELEKDNSKDWTAEKNKESTVDTSKRLSDIIGKALHDFGINYTSGTRYVKGDGVEGEYNRKNHGIRTKITNDLPTFSHEFGHWLDQKYNVITDEMPTDVLKDLKAAFEKKEENKENYTQDLIPREGFGEYIRYYLQNRDTAGMDYPKLTDYFLKKLSPEDLARLNGFADQINAYYSMDTDSAAGHIRLKEDSRPDYRTMKEKLHDWWHHGYQEWVDSNHGFRMFDIANKTDAYTYAANAAYTDARVLRTLLNAIYTPEGYYVGPSLKYALRNINTDDKKEYMDFGEYLICRHAVEWIEQKKRVFADDRKNNIQWLNNRRKELEKAYPKFSEAAEDVYRFQHDFLQTWGIGSGIISADAFEAMQKMYPEYVPFFRAGFKNRGDALKKAKGSGRDLIHPIDNIIDSVTKTMHTAMPNKVMLILRDEAVKSGADALWMEQIPEQKFAEKFSTEELKTKLKDNTAYTLWGMQASAEAVDAMQDIIDTIDDMLIQYRSGRALKSRNEFRIMVNGKPEYWKINNDLLLNSVLDMDYRDTSKVIKAFGDMNRIMTYATTGGNIAWSTTSNSVRDLFEMIVYSPAKKLPKRLRNLCDEYVQATKEEMGKSVSPIYEQYLALGGDDAQVYSGSEKYVKDIRKMLSKKKSFNPLKVTNFVSDTIEAGPRFAIFKEFIENGAEPQKAFRAAMDITVDFKRHGKNSKMMNNFILYFNASLQGVDKFIRHFTAEDRAGMKDRKKVIMGRALYFLTISAIGAALSYFLNHDDEEKKKNYNLLSTYTKNNYYSIPIPGSDGKYLTIPKAHETAVLESYMERLLEYSLDKNKHAFDEFYNYGADQFAPSGASDVLKFPSNVATKGADQAAKELLSGVFSGMGPLGVGEQIAANRNYMGRPIENTFEAEKLRPSERYNENTSQAAYLAGKYLNLSPKMVDHFGENVLGFMWKYPEALFPIDDGKGTKGQRDLTLGVGKTYIRDNTYSNDVTNYIYDKANESAMEHNSTGEKAAEAKADSNMSQFYTTFNKLSKEEPETNEKRSARKSVLNDLLDYRDKTGSLPTTQQEIYDMVDRTGDTSLMPGVMKSTIKDAEGNEHSLTSGEYVNLQKSYEDYYWRYAGESFNNSEPDEKKAYVLEQAAKLAKEQAQSDMLNQKGMASSSDKLLDWVQSGNDFDTYVDTVYNIKAIKNEYAGSDNKEERQSEIAREIQSTGLSEDSKKKLWEIAGYKATEGSYGKFF